MNGHNIKKIIGFLVVVFVVFFIYKKFNQPTSKDFKDIEFYISGTPVTLEGGVATARTSLGGESETIIRYFGNELFADIDGDEREDVVFLVTQETGGSGTFFYLVGALNRLEGYVGTHAVYIGDRIAPQNITKGEGRVVVVNYADRAPGESMVTPPSVGKSLYLLLDAENLQFGEVIQDFEGESAF